MVLYFERGNSYTLKEETGKRVGCKYELAVWIFMEGSDGRSFLKYTWCF